jgi:hypothetical protein
MALFKRRDQSASTVSTGHAGDDALLVEIGKRSKLSAPRHWVHYLHTADEAGAREAAAQIGTAGWQIERIDKAAEGPGWVVIAERQAGVTSPEAVQEARRLFERVAATVTGGDYDGWEAST